MLTTAEELTDLQARGNRSTVSVVSFTICKHEWKLTEWGEESIGHAECPRLKPAAAVWGGTTTQGVSIHLWLWTMVLPV